MGKKYRALVQFHEDGYWIQYMIKNKENNIPNLTEPVIVIIEERIIEGHLKGYRVDDYWLTLLSNGNGMYKPDFTVIMINKEI